jgi:hypothetical protein
MIEAISINEPDKERRSCYDCKFCQAAKSWWCKNEQAIETRGTSIPGVIHCPFWEPVRMKKDLTFWERFWSPILTPYVYINDGN